MATVDKLAVYNHALLLLGQRRLSSLTEDREVRYLLDGAYDLGAPEACLEAVQPLFATTTAKLSTPATSSVHDLDSVHTLPSGYLTLVKNRKDDRDRGVYSDAKLDEPVSRFIIDGNTLACEFSTIYVRYISSTLTLTDWTPSFVNVVAAYLAREISVKVAPDEHERLSGWFTDRVETAIQLDEEREPRRNNAPTVSLTNDWRLIYNDALLILGLDEITSNSDDSNRRTKLDRTLDSRLVESVLEDTGWTFGLESTKSQYDPSLEPGWGYTRVHQKNPSIHRLNGMYQDEYMRVPLKFYKDEGDYFYCDLDTIYVEYVSTSWLTTPGAWPASFARLIAARMAKDAAMSLREEGADPSMAEMEYSKRLKSAKSNDAISAPPRVIASGNWVKSRWRGTNRER